MECGKYQMAGNGCLMGYLCCFLVTHLANKYHIRVLPENRPETVCKCKPDLFVYCYLVYTFEFIFDGVFKGYHIDFRCLYMPDHCIKRRCLSASGWPCDKDYALGSLYYCLYPVFCILGTPYFLQCKYGRLWVKDTHYHLFTVLCGQGRYPHVKFSAAYPNLYSPVLRHPPLSDVHLRHYLYQIGRAHV